jgi:hypothetical protein
MAVKGWRSCCGRAVVEVKLVITIWRVLGIKMYKV